MVVFAVDAEGWFPEAAIYGAKRIRDADIAALVWAAGQRRESYSMCREFHIHFHKVSDAFR